MAIDLLREAVQLEPDVVVTDIRMPPGFGEEVCGACSANGVSGVFGQ